jgi:calcineurin-like phosphoesterase family protein
MLENEPIDFPMSDWVSKIRWLVSDWHFGEKRLSMMCRPFSSTEEHDRALIENHNRCVKPQDVVLCDGDVTSIDAPDRLALVGELNGTKLLIRGNHDEPHTDSDLRKYFVQVVGNGEGLKFEYENIRLFATHYPTQGLRDRFNIVGHVHGAWRCQLNMLNVGVDNFGFAPCHISQVPIFIDAISNHYDRDVWVAYEEVNTAYRDVRGNKTRYLSEKPAIPIDSA